MTTNQALIKRPEPNGNGLAPAVALPQRHTREVRPLTEPTLQSADLWRQSGRYDAYGPEMLRITDRHEREMLYGPTNEEMITAHLPRRRQKLPRPAAHALPYPVEVPRRGPPALRRDARPRVPDEGRLFSFDLDEAGARLQLLHAAARLSAHLPADGHPRRADEGGVGPDRRRPQPRIHRPRPDRRERSVLRRRVRGVRLERRPTSTMATRPGSTACSSRSAATYAATDETHDEARWAEVAEDRRRTGRGIEVGHIFYFGDKYSAAMGLKVSGPDGSHGHAADGQLRHRRVAPGRRDHRGQP